MDEQVYLDEILELQKEVAPQKGQCAASSYFTQIH